MAFAALLMAAPVVGLFAYKAYRQAHPQVSYAGVVQCETLRGDPLVRFDTRADTTKLRLQPFKTITFVDLVSGSEMTLTEASPYRCAPYKQGNEA